MKLFHVCGLAIMSLSVAFAQLYTNTAERSVRYQIDPVNGSGLRGSVLVADYGRGYTVVVIALSGTPRGGDHPAHFRAGSVGSDGEIAIPLQNVIGDTGFSVSVIDDAYDQIVNSDYYIDIHLSPDDLDTILASGEIGLGAEPLDRVEAPTPEVEPVEPVEPPTPEVEPVEPVEPPTPATLIYVDASTPFGGDGSEAAPFQTIQEGIDAAQEGGIIDIAAGEYPADLTIDKGVTLQGANAGTPGQDERGEESVITGTVVISSDSKVGIDGLKLADDTTDGAERIALTVQTLADHELRNSVFERAVDAQSGNKIALRVDATTAGTLALEHNLFQGSDAFTNADLGQNRSWTSAIDVQNQYSGVSVVDNTIAYTRTGMRVFSVSSETADFLTNLAGNTFTRNRSSITISGSGDYVLGANTFYPPFSRDLDLSPMTTGSSVDVSSSAFLTLDDSSRSPEIAPPNQ